MDTRTFDIGDIVSVTTGILMARRHVGAVYDLLGYMTGEQLMTHQLPRAQGQCRPHLVAQHPDLAAIEVPEPPEGGWTRETVDAWLDEISAIHGAQHPVDPLPDAQRAPQNPIEELAEMVGPERVFVFPEQPQPDVD